MRSAMIIAISYRWNWKNIAETVGFSAGVFRGNSIIFMGTWESHSFGIDTAKQENENHSLSNWIYLHLSMMSAKSTLGDQWFFTHAGLRLIFPTQEEGLSMSCKQASLNEQASEQTQKHIETTFEQTHWNKKQSDINGFVHQRYRCLEQRNGHHWDIERCNVSDLFIYRLNKSKVQHHVFDPFSRNHDSVNTSILQKNKL